MTTIVLSNGHLRTETADAAIDALIEILRDHPLNRLFEKYGDFVERDARNLRGEWLEGVENAVSFFGNFFDRSHIFSIVSNDPDHVDRLWAHRRWQPWAMTANSFPRSTRSALRWRPARPTSPGPATRPNISSISLKRARSGPMDRAMAATPC